VIMTDRQAQLLYTNRQAHELLARRRGLRVSMGRLSATNPKCAARLREAIRFCAQAKCSEELPLGVAVSIPQTDAPHIAAWVHPAGGMRTDGKEQAAAIFVRGAADVFSDEVFAAMFGATQGEIRVLKLLLTGLSVQDICAKLGLSRNTVRTHVKSLFAKTGTRRQAELVALATAAIAPASAQEFNAL
jgi:DNA-binding CsgD family transcriptional regulator